MQNKTFEATGEIREKDSSRKTVSRKFTKIVDALNKNVAGNTVKAMFGSKNKIKRKNITITEIKEV